MSNGSSDAKLIVDLANFRLNRWMDRRKHEWTITVALWASLAGIALSGKVQPSTPMLAVLLIIFVLLHSIWVGYNWFSNMADLRAAFGYIGQVHHLLLINSLPSAPDTNCLQQWLRCHIGFLEFIAAPPCFFEVAVSIVVAIFVFLNLRHGALGCACPA